MALGLASAPFYARLMQTLAASVAGRDFVAAARVAGVGRFRLLFRHILPERRRATRHQRHGRRGLDVARVRRPLLPWPRHPASDVRLGRILNGGLTGIYQNPLGALGPAAVIVIAGLAFNLFGEAAAEVIGVRTPNRLPKTPLPTTFAREAPLPTGSPVSGGPERGGGVPRAARVGCLFAG